MDTTEFIKDSLDWAEKRLNILRENLSQTQREYIEFALRQNLAKLNTSEKTESSEVYQC